jgi:hypothetical protein
MVLTGPRESAAYFKQIDQFIRLALGEKACTRYKIVIDDAVKVAQIMTRGLNKVRKYRIKHNDAFYFNWLLKIEENMQIPFNPSHENMLSLELHRDLSLHELAANLRRMFSGIVAGNVKPEGLKAIREHGPFEIRGEPAIMKALDEVLASFVADNRMKLPGSKAYEPCYRIVS